MLEENEQIATPEPQAQPSDGGFHEALSQSWDKVAAEPEPVAADAPPSAESEPDREPAQARPDPQKSTKPAKPAKPKWWEKPDAYPPFWKKEIQSSWATLPPAVREEIIRRERELSLERARAHQIQQSFPDLAETLAPYEQMFKGHSPAKVVGNLLRLTAEFESAPRATKAQILAAMARKHLGYGDDAIDLLAGELDKPVATAPRPEHIQATIQERVQYETAQARYRADRDAALDAVSKFEGEKPEFLEEVRQDFGALVALELRGGKRLDAEDLRRIYQRACKINDGVSSRIARREAATEALRINRSNQKARLASSSVKSQPAGPPSPPVLGDDTRSHIEAAWEAVSHGG